MCTCSNGLGVQCVSCKLLQITAFGRVVHFGEGPSFWGTVKRSKEEICQLFFTISAKVFVDSDASKGSQDEGTK